MRGMTVLLIAAVVVLSVPGVAPAHGAPVFTPEEVEDIIGDTSICGFAIDIHWSTVSGYWRDFFDADGNWIRADVSGALVAVYTNASDPSKTITVNMSGKGTYTPTGDDLRFVYAGHTSDLRTVQSGRQVISYHYDASTDTWIPEYVSVVGTAFKELCPAIA